MLDDLIKKTFKDEYNKTHETYSFEEYLEIVKEDPNVLRNSFQRIADMIISAGTSEKFLYNTKVTHYNFFDDKEDPDSRDAIFGVDEALNKIVNFVVNGANGLGTHKRILLLHGPVGSAKSSIARLIKKGLENYSRTASGVMYTFSWVDQEETMILGKASEVDSPMNEEPLKLLPEESRKAFIKGLDLDKFNYKKLAVQGTLNPHCKFIMEKYLEKYDGDIVEVLKNHVRVKRLLISEKDRNGIGTFQPKDEKNQDSTELTGDINYKKIALFGSDSDPRAFNFDGEFCKANRGVIEFIEMLKLDVAFLYELLTASQEKCIKPKKFAQTDIDQLIIGHTNEPEFRKLAENEFMEALNDRTVKIDIPYILKLDDEVRIYEKDYNEAEIDMTIAPHTLKIASLFSILTRLQEPSNLSLDLMSKLRLYNGKRIPNFGLEEVEKLKEDAKREGLEGISPRYIQDKIGNAIIKNAKEGYISPFMVLSELKEGIKHHVLIRGEEQAEKCRHAIDLCQEELGKLLENDVREVASGSTTALETLCAGYIDNVKCYVNREKIRDKFTNKLVEPDERLMRSIEEKVDVVESAKDDFRREVMNHIGALAIEGKQFDYKANDKLYMALKDKLFEDQSSQFKLSSYVSSKVIGKEDAERVEILVKRLIDQLGYCEKSARDAINYVAQTVMQRENEEF